MGRPRCSIARNYFLFDSDKNISVCQVADCGIEIKGNHAGNLESILNLSIPKNQKLSRKRKGQRDILDQRLFTWPKNHLNGLNL